MNLIGKILTFFQPRNFNHKNATQTLFDANKNLIKVNEATLEQWPKQKEKHPAREKEMAQNDDGRWIQAECIREML